MRRPLDWIVVSILLLVLSANRMLTAQPPRLQAGEPDIQPMVSSSNATAPPSPFAWIEEDGSLVYLPVSERDPDRAAIAVDDLVLAGRDEDPTAAPPGTSTAHALYSWSSPLAAIEQVRAPFQ